MRFVVSPAWVKLRRVRSNRVPSLLTLAAVLAAGPAAGASPKRKPAASRSRLSAPLAASEPAAEGSDVPALDIAAYFSDGPFKEAQRLVARGDTRSAAALLKRILKARPDAPERPQARYLLGLSLIRLGEYEEAARLFDELATSYPALRDDHLFFRGQALYLWGSYVQAAQALASVDPDGTRGEDARRLRAWALLKATDFEQLVHWLEEIQSKEGRLDPELTFTLARARHRTGDVLGAYRAFREVWREAPTGQLAGPALVQIADLKIGDKPMLSEGERRAIHALEAKLSSGRDSDAAMSQLDRRLEHQPNSRRLRAEIAYVRGRIAQASGRLPAASALYARALDLAPVETAELRARIGLEQGRLAESMGDAQRALASYAVVAERFSDRPEAEDALFHAGEILLSERKYAEAEAKFQALLLKNPVTAYRPRSLWGIGWARFRLGRYDQALEFFGALANMQLPADVDAASHYWLARTEANLGKMEDARRHYRAVISGHPLSHYAALAEDQLAEAIAAGEGAAEPVAGAEKITDDSEKEMTQIREYVRLGLRPRALHAIASLEKKTPGHRASEAVLHEIARIYDELGDNADARRVREECAREYPRSLGDAEFILIAKRAHPLKFEAPIRAAADEFAVSDALLFGLVRTESGFRPEIVSNMSACGLTQLLVPTAQQIAQQIHAGRANRVRLLHDPSFNVRLGAAYLRSLLDRFDGSEPLALAAYNAGPGAVHRWLAHRQRKAEGTGEGSGAAMAPAPDELAEEIPVLETRNFVKNVLARARGYARLYPRRSAKAEPPPTPPKVEVGATIEPADLPPATKGAAVAATGARVLHGRPWMEDEREAQLYAEPSVP